MSTNCSDTTAPTSLDLQDGFQIDGFQFKSIPGGFNLNEYTRMTSGGGDRFAFYQIKNLTGGFVAYKSGWKPGTISDMQFLRHYHTTPESVTNTWWRIRPANSASVHNRVQTAWSQFDGGGKQTIPGFCIFQTESDEIYRKLPDTVLQESTEGVDADYDQVHVMYQVTDSGGNPLVGFQSQYNTTGVIVAPHNIDYTLSTYFWLPPAFKIYIPPGISLMRLDFELEPDSTLELKTCLGKPPADITQQEEPNEDADAIFQAFDQIDSLQPAQAQLLISGHDNFGEVYSISPTDSPNKTTVWFRQSAPSTTGGWLYCNTTTSTPQNEVEPLQVLQARIQYTIANLTTYRAWYDTTSWDSVGDPIITEELVTNEIRDTGRERRGNHEVLTLQGWDGKTYINLKQATDPLNVRLTQIARSVGIYGTQFYDHATINSKSSKEFKDTFGDKPKTFQPTFHTTAQKTDYWDNAKIPDQLKHLPVLVCYNQVQNSIRYFAMIAYILTDTSEGADAPAETIYGGIEKQTTPIIANDDWVNPPTTATAIPSLQSSKSELTPIVLHFFEEITPAEFNSHKHISTTLPY